MPYDNKAIILDKDKKPVPQYFNEETDQFEVIKGSSNLVKSFPSERYGFSIINDGNTDLTFEINGNKRTVKGKEPYNALFPGFKKVTIVTKSAYRAEVLE